MTRATDLLVALLTLSIVASPATVDAHVSCGGRLERALDALQREKLRRNRVEEDEEEMPADLAYREELASAPLEMLVERIKVKLPIDEPLLSSMARWARVESCTFEPRNGSLGTRLGFQEASVSGMVYLQPKGASQEKTASRGVDQSEESCDMTLRMRGVSIEFFTSPVSRSRGQMRIRTESSFTEPRFASIYVYGCRPSYADERFKRQGEGWPLRYASLPVQFAAPAGDGLRAEPRSARNVLAEKSSIETGGRRRNIEKISKNSSLDLRSKESTVLREIEDVFLQAAGQALARYIERELHPAIKETLMLSMGYTISYG